MYLVSPTISRQTLLSGLTIRDSCTTVAELVSFLISCANKKARPRVLGDDTALFRTPGGLAMALSYYEALMASLHHSLKLRSLAP